jgi:hypothetical protein
VNPSADHARTLLTTAADDAYVAGLLAQWALAAVSRTLEWARGLVG